MEVKPGYKQTEVGVIPEEWVVSLLADVITSFQNGFAFASHGYVKSGIPIVTMAQIGLDGRFNFTSESVNYWPTEAASALRAFQLFRGDIIIAMTDVTPQKNLIGRMAEVTEIGPLLLNQRVGLFRLDAKKIDPYFLRAMSNSSRWRGYARAVASLGVQANIGTNDIRAGKLPLPPLSEQRAIATALSDVDGLLGGLDRLIAKKRDLKQAAMQQLLTGQTRLPGFHGAWEVKRLGEIAHIKTGSRNNEDKIEDGDYPFFVRSENIERINSYSHDCEAILVPGEGRIGDIFHYINGRFDVHQRVYAITQFKAGISAKFIHLYMAKNFGAWAMQNTVKATVDSLRLPTFQTFAMRVPPTKDEQTALAEVLSDMDAELSALEARCDKTRALKQAMMQELLTGKTRLVPPGGAHA